MESAIDVVVVGAGPVGLLTAIELTLGGARVLVLERLAAPSTTLKALGVGPLGSEALQRRGMAQALDDVEARSLAAIARPGDSPRGRSSKFSGHFAGLTLLRKDVLREPERRMRMANQQALEALLDARVSDLDIAVRRDCTVTGVAQRVDGVDVRWSSPSGDDQVSCAWVVGCDGGHSIVRKLAGLEFPGTPATLTMYQASLTIDRPDRLTAAGWHRTPGGVYSYGFLPDRLFMLDFSGPPADRLAPVTRDEIDAVLRRVSCADVRVTAVDSASRWADNTRLVDTYRRDRVLLAGDAAHVHSPFGGQGLSLGLVDAANLGWKLAAVVRGDLPEALLDTYGAERRPVADAVLANTRAQVAIMRPDPQAGAMRDLFARLLAFDDVNRFVGETMSGLGTRYDVGLEADDAGRLAGDRPVGEDLMLYGLMQDGRGVLLDASVGQRATGLVMRATRHVRCVAVETGPSMLVRPDACIAWVGEDGGVDGLDAALDRWFSSGRRVGTAPQDVETASAA